MLPNRSTAHQAASDRARQLLAPAFPEPTLDLVKLDWFGGTCNETYAGAWGAHAHVTVEVETDRFTGVGADALVPPGAPELTPGEKTFLELWYARSVLARGEE